ncbi:MULTISPECIES: glycosyltransferase family 2 protein [Bombella]|uniref:Glycosyltransferase family 2 protein n=1 Tax=Bombella pollinis TaxID=2967337 RepID=A0ABT3WMU8_9PROT|nr:MULTISPECIES: glycosyltransferase family 2 protein [Bombella]MCT6838192.1 glycosyltransferase family 2 protein [Bifidobacteriales bacterium]MCX5619169.1 glycosyltransferase family 2 protein [Bombella pollinis]MUG89308.1 glycosyltransferase [Bombella sp. ESL0385]
MTSTLTASKPHNPLLAVVITVFNESDNILPVCEELCTVLTDLPPAEVIIVDDGSTDTTQQKLLEAKVHLLPQLRIIVHPTRMGKSAALRSAIRAAHAPWIATMDGDGQDNPAFIQTMLAARHTYETTHGVKSPAPLIVGVRRKRRDSFSRRFATRLANTLRQHLLHDHCPDTGGPLKLFQRDLFLTLPHFEGLHRFLPALMQSYGAPLICIETQHRARLHGHSKYNNMNRALVGIFDLLGVLWLQKRTRPLPPLSER